MPAIPASHRDLLDGEFATLGTVGPDGRPCFPRCGSWRRATRSGYR
jgi:hypothetical protein